jgi:hypothetical protein
MLSVRLFIILLSFFLAACGGGNNEKIEVAATDTLLSKQDSINNINKAEVLKLKGSTAPFINTTLAKWIASFPGFSIDSFHFIQKGLFEQIDYEAGIDYKTFLSLYSPSLIFSADSSYFIDLYSGGTSLKKKGKKIIAISDADQTITLYNTKTKEWKRIAFFGPSAGVEEGVWISATQFILTGMMHNDDGIPTPIMMIGDVATNTLGWFEAGNKRPDTTSYKPSGMINLKIDEWE